MAGALRIEKTGGRFHAAARGNERKLHGVDTERFHFLEVLSQRTRVDLHDGSYWRYEYDSLGQVRSGKKYWADGSPVAGQQFEYSHDEIGNRTGTKAGGDENGANLREASYTPNVLNQYSNRTVPGAVDVMGIALATSTVTVNGQAPYRKGEYFRKELTAANGTSPVWQSIQVQATGETPVNGSAFVPRSSEYFQYDPDGNLTNDGRWAYTWDGENRLIGMAVNTNIGPQHRLEFSYDWKGRRISKKVWTNGAIVRNEKFVYDGWNLLAELNGTNNAVIRSYVRGTDLSGSMQGAGGVGGLLAVNDRASGVHFTAFDGNGNVAALFSAAAGTNSARYEYGPFGELLRATGPMAKANPFRFSTKYQDDETDLLYYGYRYYNASTGRWISRDPIGERGGPNLCGFVNNRPTSKIDPFGLTNEPGAFGWSNYSVQVFQNQSTGDNSSAYGLGTDWLSGDSPPQRSFSGNDPIAQQMRSTPEAAEARKKLEQRLKGGCSVGMSAPLSRSLFEEGPGAFYEGFVEDVAGRNPSRAFMGSFSGDATVTECWACCAVVRFTIRNTAGWQSATRMPPPFGYDSNRVSLVEDPGSIPSSLLPNNVFGQYGRNVEITVSWVEFICPQNSVIKQQ